MDQIQGLMRAQVANKLLQRHDLQTEKIYIGQQRLKIKAAMKWFDEEKGKSIGV